MTQKTGIVLFLMAAVLGFAVLFLVAGRQSAQDLSYMSLINQEEHFGAKEDNAVKEKRNEFQETGKTEESGGNGVLTETKQSGEKGSSEGMEAQNEAGKMISAAVSEEKAAEKEICVYVCGKVKNPGVYCFSEGARLSEVILAAGGFSGKAAEEYLNLAKKAEDGQRVYVPSKKEVRNLKDGTGDEAQAENAGEGLSKTISEEKAEEVSAEKILDGKVNLNTAQKEELMTLTGIGEAKADAILAYRKEHGGFASTEELMEISGIKEGVYQKLCDFITV